MTRRELSTICNHAGITPAGHELARRVIEWVDELFRSEPEDINALADVVCRLVRQRAADVENRRRR